MKRFLYLLTCAPFVLPLAHCNGRVVLGELDGAAAAEAGPTASRPDDGAASAEPGGSNDGAAWAEAEGSNEAATPAAATMSDAAGSTTADASGAGPLSRVYSGYIEGFKFQDGSDAVKMTLSFNADGTVTGTVFFGNGPALPPPTDANVGYPPGAQVQGDPPGVYSFSPTDFAYTILKGTYAAPRLQLQVDTKEVFKAWCELQTQIYMSCNCGPGPGCGSTFSYACLPNSATMLGGTNCAIMPCGQTQWTSIDCGKLTLCSTGSPCTCTATSCTVQVGPMGDVAFDTQVTPGAINGSVTGLSEAGVAAGQTFNVHLTQQP